MSWTTYSRRFARDTGPACTGVESFPDYIARVNPRFHIYKHNNAINEALKACLRHEIENLMVWLPPGTGKSEQISRLFGSYVLAQHPDETVGITSCGAMRA